MKTITATVRTIEENPSLTAQFHTDNERFLSLQKEMRERHRLETKKISDKVEALDASEDEKDTEFDRMIENMEKLLFRVSVKDLGGTMMTGVDVATVDVSEVTLTYYDQVTVI